MVGEVAYFSVFSTFRVHRTIMVLTTLIQACQEKTWLGCPY